ncbi:MAG: adenylosuccinate synthase [Ignavibacteria bacterium]|nr:adenylosuccinate synthase [Ignavibacteria bacterium]
MNVKLIIGAQWGDEGKGKIVDILSSDVDIVARYQGGANAGHTVIVGQKKYVLHLIPSGILHPKALCVIGNGVVLDPIAFFEEAEILKQNGIEVENRIIILPNTHIIFSFHKLIDQLSEVGANKIGTTGRGIGPAYSDKYSRIGIRAIDLFNENIVYQKILDNLKIKNVLLKSYFNINEINAEQIFEEAKPYLSKLKKYITDDSLFLSKQIASGKKVIVEGAQGALLDVDHGTYPFVTSSNPTCGGALTGLGITPKSINEIIGIAKAYTTRVGEGPFPTELRDKYGDKIRELGAEFGATTGRPRRCGWLDLVALKFSTQLNGFDYLAITKLDVLSQFDEIKVCIAYESNGSQLDYFPSNTNLLMSVKPIYVTLKGWQSSISTVKYYEELPAEAKDYLNYIEDYISTKIKIISTGSERNQTIFRQ